MTHLEFREELRRLYAKGRSARKEIDAFLGQHEANSEDDLYRLFACATETELGLLQMAISEGRLIRLRYRQSTPDGEQGCIVGVLFGHRSTDDLLDHDYPDHETFLAVNRVIRAWDYDELSLESLAGALDDLIESLEFETRQAADIWRDYDAEMMVSTD